MPQSPTSTGFIVILEQTRKFTTFPGREDFTSVGTHEGGQSYQHIDFGPNSTNFGFVTEGIMPFSQRVGNIEIAINLHAGMYWSFRGPGRISPVMGKGKCTIIENWDFRGFFMAGGPVEEKGRLKYINGATDTLLIPPIKMGDPCLNYLHFPPNTQQAQHTHPSLRIGIVFRGRGHCVLPSGVPILLKPGMTFAILPETAHAFITNDSSLDVISYHPDSDFGPQDTIHPVINRTIIDGQSASDLPAIHTG